MAQNHAASAYNPYFVAYATERGNSPERQLFQDSELYVGGKMAGFLIWLNQKWGAFMAERGYKGPRGWHNSEFGLWLEGKDTNGLRIKAVHP